MAFSDAVPPSLAEEEDDAVTVLHDKRVQRAATKGTITTILGAGFALARAHVQAGVAVSGCFLAMASCFWMEALLLGTARTRRRLRLALCCGPRLAAVTDQDPVLSALPAPEGKTLLPQLQDGDACVRMPGPDQRRAFLKRLWKQGRAVRKRLLAGQEAAQLRLSLKQAQEDVAIALTRRQQTEEMYDSLNARHTDLQHLLGSQMRSMARLRVNSTASSPRRPRRSQQRTTEVGDTSQALAISTGAANSCRFSLAKGTEAANSSRFSLAKGTEGTLSSHGSQDDPDEEASVCDVPAFAMEDHESESDLGTAFMDPRSLTGDASPPRTQALCPSRSEGIAGGDASAEMLLGGGMTMDREWAHFSPTQLRCACCGANHSECNTVTAYWCPLASSALQSEEESVGVRSTGLATSDVLVERAAPLKDQDRVRKRRRSSQRQLDLEASADAVERTDKENDVRLGPTPAAFPFVKRPRVASTLSAAAK